jgi:Phage integrase family
VRLQDLHHSFASVLVNRGASLYVVQILLGHTQTKTTQRYTHLTQNTLSEAAEIVGRAMQPSTLPQPAELFLANLALTTYDLTRRNNLEAPVRSQIELQSVFIEYFAKSLSQKDCAKNHASFEYLRREEVLVRVSSQVPRT